MEGLWMCVNLLLENVASLTWSASVTNMFVNCDKKQENQKNWKEHPI